MSTPENLSIALASIEAWNAHDMDWWSELRADDFLSEGLAAAGPIDKQLTLRCYQNYLAAFPNVHIDVTLAAAEGDHIILQWTATGTQTGPMHTPSGKTIPPPGKHRSLSGSTTFEIKDGKITRTRTHWDVPALLRQLSMAPPV